MSAPDRIDEFPDPWPTVPRDPEVTFAGARPPAWLVDGLRWVEHHTKLPDGELRRLRLPVLALRDFARLLVGLADLGDALAGQAAAAPVTGGGDTRVSVSGADRAGAPDAAAGP